MIKKFLLVGLLVFSINLFSEENGKDNNFIEKVKSELEKVKSKLEKVPSKISDAWEKLQSGEAFSDKTQTVRNLILGAGVTGVFVTAAKTARTIPVLLISLGLIIQCDELAKPFVRMYDSNFSKEPSEESNEKK